MTLVQNELAVALLGDQTEYEGPAPQPLLPLVHRPRRARPTTRPRTTSGTRAATSPTCAPSTAATATTPKRGELVELLRAESPEFARLWDEHEVGVRRDTHKRVVHPTIGVIDLDCQILTAENQTERLIVFTAAPGSEDAARLELLSVVGGESFAV